MQFTPVSQLFKKRQYGSHPLPYVSAGSVQFFFSSEMANARTYKNGVKIGNWYENLCLEEVCASFIVTNHSRSGGCSFD